MSQHGGVPFGKGQQATQRPDQRCLPGAVGAEQAEDFAALDFDSSRPNESTFGAWIRERNRRQGFGTALADEALAFARERGYKRIRGRLPSDNEPALSYLSAIGALVPLKSPGTTFELPVYDEDMDRGN